MNVHDNQKIFRWLILISISIMAFVMNGDYLAVNSALIPISAEFNTNLDTVQWILSGYMLAWATLVIPAGVLLDRYNGKILCIMGISIFLLASVIAGLSTSINMLILSRVIQGVGGAIFLPTIYAMIHANFNEDERGLAMGVIGFSVGVGLAFGPVIGGALITWSSWRSIFFINIPIGIIAIIINSIGENLYPDKDKVTTTGWASVLMLATVSICTLYGLNGWQHWVDNSRLYISVALAILVAMILFVRLQRNTVLPLISSSLMKNHAYWGCCLGILLVEYSFSTIIIIMGLYLQDVLHLSSFVSSNIFLSMTIVFGVIAALGGPWIDKVGFITPTIYGLAITAQGSFLFYIFSGTYNLWIISLLFIIMGIGVGLSFTALNTGIVKTVSGGYVGIATSIFLMITLMGNAIGVTTATIIYQYASFQSLFGSLSAKGYLFNIEEKNQLALHISSMGGKEHALSAFNSTLQSDILNNITAALTSAANSAMLVNFVLSTAVIIIFARLLKPKSKLVLRE